LRVALLAALLVAADCWAAPRIVAPADLSAPRPVVRIDGLPPSGTVELVVTRRSQDGGRVAEGRQRHAVPADATLLLDTHAELAAFWDTAARPPAADDPAPGTARIRLAGAPDATARSRPDPASLEILRETPFPGALLVKPKGNGRLPVIMVLGGSEGGDSFARELAPMIAARGYAVLGLPYVAGFGPTQVAGLPQAFSELPVDRLEEVRRWLATRDDVDAARIGLYGVSKGAEFALIAAANFRWVAAVAAIVPSDVVWEGWGRPPPQSSSFALAGQPLPFVPYHEIEAEFAKIQAGGRPDLLRAHVEGRARNPDRVAAARIPIERFRGPLLLVGGGADPIWPSLAMAKAVAASRAASPVQTILIGEAEAGHGLAGPGIDPAPIQAGGTAEAVSRARFHAWDATFDLFDKALKATP
jgi:dienelactone hydrolase